MNDKFDELARLKKLIEHIEILRTVVTDLYDYALNEAEILKNDTQKELNRIEEELDEPTKNV